MRALRRPTMDGPDRGTDLVYSPIGASPSCNALSRSSSVGRCRREERGSCRNTIKPIAQVWTSWPPNKIRISCLQAQSRGKCDLRKVECSLHPWMCNSNFPQVGHSSRAFRLCTMTVIDRSPTGRRISRPQTERPSNMPWP